ncbi:diguanylate cyclase [Planctomycetota bacterium]
MVPTIKDIKEVVNHTGKVITIKEENSAADAAKKMSEHNIGSLLVLNQKGIFVGVLTERDMLKKVLTNDFSPADVLVRDIMTSKPLFCSMETPIAEAEKIMDEHKIRHLPIVKDGVPISMASTRDLIAYQLHSNKAMKGAAEQLAMLSTRLKSLDFDDVIDLAINEVPKSFGAEQAVLCLLPKGTGSATIYRKGCLLRDEKLFKQDRMKEAKDTGQVIYGNCSQECKKAGCNGPGLFIPLSIYEEGEEQKDNKINVQGFLCMCRFQQSSVESKKLQFYKASLLQEVLNINLTNSILYQNYQQARRDSKIDPLTGLGTRRVLKKALKAECDRAARYNRCFSVAIVDLDKFKQINDNAGHAAGDSALQHVVKVMRENIRETDVIITRYGGDEFVLLIPETKLDGAKVLLERLRKRVEELSIPGVKSLTISCGISQWQNTTPADNPKSILSRADTALYEAKEKGRNCVIVSHSETNSF